MSFDTARITRAGTSDTKNTATCSGPVSNSGRYMTTNSAPTGSQHTARVRQNPIHVARSR